LHSKQKFLG